MIRKRCVKNGHDWIEFWDGYRPPVQTCARWFCHGARPDPGLHKETREFLQRAIEGRTA